MVALYSRARTGVVLTAAGAALLATLAIRPASTQPVIVGSPAVITSDIVRPKLTSREVLAGPQDIAVLLKLPVDPNGERENRVSIAIVLDRSASMHGEPLENAKRAAMSLIDGLSSNDTFALVTFSDRDELLIEGGRADAARKRLASDAIDRIVASGGTCASCGITRGAHELESNALRGIHRVVVISDGQANIGVRDRDALVELAGTITTHGISISTVGVGLDFDEQTMIRIGQTGHGNYYFAKDTAQLGAMFSHELASMRSIAATHVVLTASKPLFTAYGTTLDESEPTNQFPISDLGEGEARKIVLRGAVTGPSVATFSLTWVDPGTGIHHHAEAPLATTITTEPARVEATRDGEATEAVAQARAAMAIEQAVLAYQQDGAAAAKRSLARAQITTDVNFELSSDEVVKTLRSTAYELSR